jgi:hypothetical protein
MMAQAYKCDRCQSWITHGFEFTNVNKIDGNKLTPIVKIAKCGPHDVARISDCRHYCHNCAFEELFPEKVEHPQRGGPGDW